VRWRGSFDAAVYDLSNHAFQIVPDVLRRNPKCLDSFADPLVASLVVVGSRLEVVSWSIHFDRNPCGLAKKVEDERSEWILAAKLETFGAQL
jgi:hypothetical protein